MPEIVTWGTSTGLLLLTVSFITFSLVICAGSVITLDWCDCSSPDSSKLTLACVACKNSTVSPFMLPFPQAFSSKNRFFPSFDHPLYWNSDSLESCPSLRSHRVSSDAPFLQFSVFKAEILLMRKIKSRPVIHPLLAVSVPAIFAYSGSQKLQEKGSGSAFLVPVMWNSQWVTDLWSPVVCLIC